MALRRDRVDAATFPALVADLNEFILRNSVHLDESDHVLVNRYIAAAEAVHAAMASAPADVRESYSKTDAIRPDGVSAGRFVKRARQAVKSPC